MILISKTPRTPGLSTIQDALNMIKTEVKAATEETVEAVETVRVGLRDSAADIKRCIKIREETEGSSKEAAERCNKVVEMVKEIRIRHRT